MNINDHTSYFNTTPHISTPHLDSPVFGILENIKQSQNVSPMTVIPVSKVCDKLYAYTFNKAPVWQFLDLSNVHLIFNPIYHITNAYKLQKEMLSCPLIAFIVQVISCTQQKQTLLMFFNSSFQSIFFLSSLCQ